MRRLVLVAMLAIGCKQPIPLQGKVQSYRRPVEYAEVHVVAYETMRAFLAGPGARLEEARYEIDRALRDVAPRLAAEHDAAARVYWDRSGAPPSKREGVTVLQATPRAVSGTYDPSQHTRAEAEAIGVRMAGEQQKYEQDKKVAVAAVRSLAEEQAQPLQAQFDELQRRMRDWESDAFAQLAALPAIATVFSDANGAFTVRPPGPGRYAIVAQGSGVERLRLSDPPTPAEYRWARWISPDKSQHEVSLELSEGNVLRSDGRDFFYGR